MQTRLGETLQLGDPTASKSNHHHTAFMLGFSSEADASKKSPLNYKRTQVGHITLSNAITKSITG